MISFWGDDSMPSCAAVSNFQQDFKNKTYHCSGDRCRSILNAESSMRGCSYHRSILPLKQLISGVFFVCMNSWWICNICYSQLVLRARLLNSEFQRSIIDVVGRHAESSDEFQARFWIQYFHLLMFLNSILSLIHEIMRHHFRSLLPWIHCQLLTSFKSDSKSMSFVETSSEHDKNISIECKFNEGVAPVHVFTAVPKRLERMVEKLSEYVWFL